MSQVTPAQTSFNGGELSQRLRARIDQSLYSISLSAMVGFAPLVEGPAEAIPGTIHVEQLLGPSRCVRFESLTTQGHALYFSDLKVQIFTNDALLVTIDSPYTWAQVQELTFHQSYDVLYCCHPGLQTRKFFRDDADTFGFELLALLRGPFEPRNSDKTIKVYADNVSGAVTLTANSAMFVATDVGSALRMEAEDLGDITAWEPYITVTTGQLLTANDRVYQVVGGNPDGTGAIRTGTLTPIHTEGVEWDGIAKGVDINGKPAGGVRLEYVHDRFGELTITGYTSSTVVSATVTRHLPFSAVNTSGGYVYYGAYWDAGYTDYVPPTVAVAYEYGTYRWSFGSFSDTRGWPRCAAVWNERLCLGSDSNVYASVAGDLENFAERNEAGEVSNDMAFTAILKDPNPILHLVDGDRLLAITATGVHALSAAGAATGVGPGNIKAARLNDGKGGMAMPVLLDSRDLHISADGRRIYETGINPQRDDGQEIDLTRYARHIGKPGFVALAVQQSPFNHLWAALGDGTLALAAYLPDEQVLGWARRPLAPGVAARSLCAITDPDGIFDQLWLAVEYGGKWHALRMAPWREDGDYEETACMTDLASLYEGVPATEFTHPILHNADIHVVADGKFTTATTAANGKFTLRSPASKVWAGLPFEAYIESLDWEAGGDGGPARAKKARFSKAWFEFIGTRGLGVGVPGDVVPAEQLYGDSPTDAAFTPDSDYRLRDSVGNHTRHPRLRLERSAPFQATVMAWGGELKVETL